MAGQEIALLLCVLIPSLIGAKAAVPSPCSRIECPSYEVVEKGNAYEIRRYGSSPWVSTSVIQDISFVNASNTGFMRLFNYIQGKNDYNQKVEMTAPVMTQVTPSDGPFCASSFLISFYVPKANQANPPPAKGLYVQRWKNVYVAVRQFGGFVTDLNVVQEAAALEASLAGTKWSGIVGKSSGSSSTSVYAVAQYNSPFEFNNRVNEIWFTSS